MNLLIFDQEYENNHTDYIQPLVDNIVELKADLIRDFHEAKNSFMQHTYDFVIVDFTTEDGKKILDLILQINPNQKIITITYELTSSTTSCSECERLYNKRRLIKPINALDIFKTIKNFDDSKCKYAHYFENPKSLIPTLMLRYECFKFIEESSSIERNKDFNEHAIKEYVEIIDILDRSKIKYELIDEFTIKII